MWKSLWCLLFHRFCYHYKGRIWVGEDCYSEYQCERCGNTKYKG